MGSQDPLSDKNQRFTSAGGNASAQVSASNPSCAWSASATVDWISIGSPSSGSENGTVTYTVAPYSGMKESQGRLTIQVSSVVIRQTGTVFESNLLKNPGFEDGLSDTDTDRPV